MIAAANLRWAYALVATLKRAGVTHFVVSAGARSVPLVLAVAQLDEVQVWTHPDERVAGFWALGIGKALHRPAALICTSGTAAANYYPAVIEAHYSRTPLIVLTADRPPRLRNRGAPQTIDQVNLYAQYPLLFRDLLAPEDGSTEWKTWIEAGSRAVLTAAGSPGGPVHLNAPFDEPLVPAPEMIDSAISEITASVSEVTTPLFDRPGPATDPDSDWDNFAEALQGADRPLIVVGPQNDCDDLANDVTALARRIGAPIFADIASQVRVGPASETGIVAYYDLALRHAATASAFIPDCVLRLGGLPTSKMLNEWLAQQKGLTYIAVASGATPADPYANVTHPVTADLRHAARQLTARLATAGSSVTSYREHWVAADSAVRSLIASARSERSGTDCFEGDCVAFACGTAPFDAAIYLANSLPIRMADMFAESGQIARRILVNRGANGIDGLISSAAGAAALSQPVVLIIGDIAFQHDLNGLVALTRNRVPVKIVLINNNGGGIFSFLPLAAHRDILEPLIAMPHGLDFSRAAAFCDIPYRRVRTLAEFASAYQDMFSQDGPGVVEVQTSRAFTKLTMDSLTRRIAEHPGGLV